MRVAVPVGPGTTSPGSAPLLHGRSLDPHPVSRAKVTPTPVRDSTLSRERLLDWLRENVRRRLTLVTAEAGYGKTTLLADFSRRRYVRCLWYKLDSNDRDWTTFVHYLLAAVREVEPDFGESTSALLGHMALANPSRQRVLDSLVAELDALRREPTLLILDDFHLVDDTAEVREIVGRLVREAPESLTLLIMARRRPALPLGRLAAQGELAELTASDLRFSVQEIERLFGDIYGQSLDGDLLAQVDARTEGWAASLQLLHSSIRGRSAHEIRAFVRSLSGAQGVLYDFLAEEVVAELRPEMQRALIHASLLEHVVPEHLIAIFAPGREPRTRGEIVRLMEEAERLGLLARGGEGSTALRFHPLLRDFLQRQLHQTVSEEELRAIHGRVARAAESDDWLAACHHYIEADEPREAMRVLADSVVQAIGSGRWKAAAEVLERLRGIDLEPAAAVILSWREVDQGHPRRALALLDGLDSAYPSPTEKGLIRAARMHAFFWSGHREGLLAAAREIVSDAETAPVLRELAEAHLLLTDDDTSWSRTRSQRLQQLAVRQATTGLNLAAGISLHNAMIVEWAQANYNVAIHLGNQALARFDLVNHVPRESYATHSTLALCWTELGRAEEATANANAAAAAGVRDADAVLECAYLALVTGEIDRAVELYEFAQRLEQSDIGSTAVAQLARSLIALSTGDTASVDATLCSVQSWSNSDLGSRSAVFTWRALAALAVGDRQRALSLANDGLELARIHNARRWEALLRLVVAGSTGCQEELRRGVEVAAGLGHLGLLEAAPALVPMLELLDPLPAPLEDSIERWPLRWLPLLRKQLQAGESDAGTVAARLLERYGTQNDIPLLRAYERRFLKRRQTGSLARSLARRISPRLHINDLGRSCLSVGARSVPISRVRRKAASLLMYLITRPSTNAAREQVLDQLWPDLEPSAAANSLNQTLYFLRREIDPWYDDDVSVDYVRFESEMLWLEPELVDIASVSFLSAATRAASAPPSEVDGALEVIRSYSGRFAPEFEYEEWALGWRDTLHAQYLHLVHTTQLHLIDAMRLAEATQVAQTTLQIDPDATDVERDLIWLYSTAGARSAAAEQYEHYAMVHREQLGVEPPTFEDLTRRPIERRFE